MRPIRLEIEGFTSFRDRTVVDFADADLFALVGPTGAGKSSLIDAIVFALFGTVPRYGDARLVGSVINQRSARALVDLHFGVGDRTYRIVREVSRQKRGGSTREARLEDAETGESLMDGDARELTARVERLLGLTRDQFTKCVVLPQGEFQRFLHDKPGQRQDLLVQLLGAEVYGRIGERARQEQKATSARVQVLGDQCDALEVQLAEEPVLTSQLAALARLQEVVDDLLPGLEGADVEESALVERLERLDDRLERLGAIVRPDGLDDLAEAVADLDEELATMRKDEESHATREREAEAASASLPAPGDLAAAVDRQQRRATLFERIEKGERLVEQAAGDQRHAEAGAEAAAASLRRAEDEVELVRREHAAAHLAAGLEVGDDCPVCHRPLAEPPRHEGTDLALAESGATDARRQLDAAGTRRDETLATHERYRSQLDLLREQAAALGSDTDDPPVADLEARLAQVVAADEALTSARLARRTAAERREVSERKRQKVAKIETAAWDEFDVARDRVAVLEPPKVTRRDLAGAWSTLVDWADTCRREVEDRRAETATERAAVDRRRQAADDALTTAFAAAELARPERGAREMVAARRARNEAEIDRLVQVRTDLTRLEADRRAAEEGEQVAGELGNLLRSNAFEKWLLDAATSALVAGAGAKLEELSRGQYGMAVDARSGGFWVIDHHDVDERRPARTLSGGETFLASLALALALAEQVADLAAAEAPKIESIFLDEGFGTLDPDTLEVVVAAIEELQAGGLVVGLVSHVTELAERVPTRFEVRKGPGGSTVERVDR